MKEEVGNFSKEMETVRKHLNETLAYESPFSSSMTPACTRGGVRMEVDVKSQEPNQGEAASVQEEAQTRWEDTVLMANGQSMGAAGLAWVPLSAELMLSPAT